MCRIPARRLSTVTHSCTERDDASIYQSTYHNPILGFIPDLSRYEDTAPGDLLWSEESPNRVTNNLSDQRSRERTHGIASNDKAPRASSGRSLALLRYDHHSLEQTIYLPLAVTIHNMIPTFSLIILDLDYFPFYYDTTASYLSPIVDFTLSLWFRVGLYNIIPSRISTDHPPPLLSLFPSGYS